MEFAINTRVWIEKLDSYAVVIGVTSDGQMVVKWYDKNREHFTAIVAESDCSYNKSKLSQS